MFAVTRLVIALTLVPGFTTSFVSPAPLASVFHAPKANRPVAAAVLQRPWSRPNQELTHRARSSSSLSSHDDVRLPVGPTRTTDALLGGKKDTVDMKASPSHYQPRSGLASLWHAYLDVLERKPLLTKMASSAFISAISDTLAQVLTFKGDIAYFVLDKQRFALFVFLGAVYGPPIGHTWFNFLDRTSKHPAVAKRLPAGKYGPALFQLLLDQTFAAALVNSGFLLIFWLSQAALSGQPINMASAFARLSHEFWPMMTANWKLWPIANLISFTFVPLNLRVLYSNVVSIAWTAFMSATANS